MVSGDPFGCDPNGTDPFYFLAQATPTQLLGGEFTNSTINYHNLGTASLNYNALGFDPLNNFLYAIATSGGSADLIRIDATGGVASLGSIAGFPYTSTNVGAFDSSGDFWVTKTNTTTAYEIDVTSATPHVTTTRTLSSPFAASDWTWTPASGGYFWGLAGNKIYRVDISSGAVLPIPVPNSFPTTASSVFGAAWTYGNGNLGFSNNVSGLIDQVFVTNPSGSI